MKEQPNLSYVHQLSGGDKQFEDKLLNVVRTELPQEVKKYLKSIQLGNFEEAAHGVHKLKHKISILGLEESYRFAEIYEEELRDGANIRQGEFETILQTMLAFIKEY